MKHAIIALFAPIVLLSQSAFAVCTWEWRGIHSGWRCPAGETVIDNYRDLFLEVRKTVTGPCAQAIGRYYEKDFACLSAISAAVETGGASGAVIGIGAAQTCKQIGPAIGELNNACAASRLQFQNRGGGANGVTARACNNAGERIRVAVGYNYGGEWGATGFYVIDNGRCMDVLTHTGAIYLRGESLDGRRSWVPSQFNQGNFCVGTGFNLHFLYGNSRCAQSLGNWRWAKFGEVRDVHPRNGIARFQFN